MQEPVRCLWFPLATLSLRLALAGCGVSGATDPPRVICPGSGTACSGFVHPAMYGAFAVPMVSSLPAPGSSVVPGGGLSHDNAGNRTGSHTIAMVERQRSSGLEGSGAYTTTLEVVVETLIPWICFCFAVGRYLV